MSKKLSLRKQSLHTFWDTTSENLILFLLDATDF